MKNKNNNILMIQLKYLVNDTHLQWSEIRVENPGKRFQGKEPKKKGYKKRPQGRKQRKAPQKNVKEMTVDK